VVASDALVPRPVDARDLRKANEVFAEDSSKSFQLGLGDLSTDAWSLLPGTGNFVGEIHRADSATLTYTRSKSDPEGHHRCSHRLRRRNIAVYASEDTLARRGPSYSDDDSREYDVIDYNIDLAVSHTTVNRLAQPARPPARSAPAIRARNTCSSTTRRAISPRSTC